jgi:tetratricopeptide (TPR) repeat protein
MKTKSILLFILLSIYHFISFAQSNGQLWTKGNNAYQNKEYQNAIKCYEQIQKSEPNNAIMYFNLGNAYYKINDISHAVLNYERALFFKPEFKEAKDNLKLSKSRIVNPLKEAEKIFFLKWWEKLTSGTNTNTIALCGLIIFLFFIAIILWAIANNKLKKIPFQFYLFIPIFNLLIFYLSYLSLQNKLNSNVAIVMNNNSFMQVQPNTTKGKINIPMATSVKIGEKKGNWIEVTLPDNRTGWMLEATLQNVQINNKKQ